MVLQWTCPLQAGAFAGEGKWGGGESFWKGVLPVLVAPPMSGVP